MNSATFRPSTGRAGEFPVVSPKVWINGKQVPHFTCVAIEENADSVPSKAILRLMPELLPDAVVPGEARSPNTLNALAEINPTYGSRVAISADDVLLFTGQMLRKEDNGASDTIMWTAYDDRNMLAKIPIRGAIVLDEYKTGDVYAAKFLSRFNTICNPGGLWNCVGHKVAIPGHPLNGEVVPIFSARAHLRQNYESPDAVFTETLADGVLTAWTPKRLLKYIWFVLHIGVPSSGALGPDGTPFEDPQPDIPGLKRSSWRSLRNYPRVAGQEASLEAPSKYWEWGYSTIGSMIGAEPGSDIDPLDRKLPTINLQGMMALQAISNVLTAAGTHNFKVTGEPIIEDKKWTGEFKSTFEFFPVGFTANMPDSTTQSSIPLVRSGKASDIPNANTAYDFQLAEDATFTQNSVLVEGDVVRAETQVSTGAALVPAWSDEEEEAFKRIIWGGTDSAVGDNDYARYPFDQSVDDKAISEFSTWLIANGKSQEYTNKDGDTVNVTAQLAFARTAEALQLARKIFPRVFRAFRLDSEDAEVTNALDGFDDRYEDENNYPVGKMNRQTLAAQLQFQLSDLGGGSGTENWLEQKFPVRVQVKNVDDWQDAVYTNISSLGEGVFLIDMAEQYNGRPQCIYNGSLFASGLGTLPNTLDVTLKSLKMNLAFPMDHRVNGYAASDPRTNRDIDLINNFYLTDTGDDGYIQYIDSPIGYREEHQVNSTPTPNTEMITGGDKTLTTPLNRLLPPGSEAENAENAARRKLYTTQRIDRRSSWKMVGVRPEWNVGIWINDVYQIDVSSGGVAAYGDTPSYPINAPILSVVHNFQSPQHTAINGLIGESI